MILKYYLNNVCILINTYLNNITKMNAHEERKLNSTFEKLQKKFHNMKLKEQADKALEENLTMSERFEIQTRNFENSLFNSTLYNIQDPIKEIPLVFYYCMSNELEEFIYGEYFRTTYPYSSVTFENTGSQRRLKIVLLDEDREKFLFKFSFRIEQRMIPEVYFVPEKKY